MLPYVRYATEKQAEIVTLIREMVQLESPSDSPAGIDHLLEFLIEQTRDIASAEFVPALGFGRHLRLEFKLPGTADGQLLALGHSDTVWPLGTLQNMPFREVDGRLWGPGVLDMKAGLAFFIYAMRALHELSVPVARKVVLLIVSDEEIGSPSSRPLTEAEARRSNAVLVLEPGTGLTGKLKTARKGVGSYSVFIEGKAAHAGVDFPNGASAILEASRQVLRIAEFTDLSRGTTVNPGLIAGGTRTNVIAAQARVDVDIRVARLAEALSLDEKFRSLTSIDERCTIQVTGGLNRPPMERTTAIEALFFKARELGSEMGVTVEESSTGGGSDGNFTAALGVPTLDGLGAVGEGAHARNESILIDRMADRVALLAGLVAGV